QACRPFDQDALARARFELGRHSHRQFEGVRFRDAASAEAVLGKKMELLQSTKSTYVNAIGAGAGNWAIAALHGVAILYRSFGEFIASAPLPSNLSAAQRQQYQDALNKQGQEYVQKGAETLGACAERAKELKVLNEYAAACLA